MYKRIITAFICLFSIASYAGAVSENIRLSSPNGDNVVTINGIGKHLSYGVRHHGVQILKQSTLSMTVDGIQWGVNDNPKKIIRDNNCSEVFFAVPRKFSQCMNDYNEVTIVYKDYNVQFRAYDEGVAYRFIGGKNTVGEIGSEEVNYVFDPSDTSYVLLTDKLQNWFEEQYSIRKIGDLPKDSISIMPVMTKVNGLDILIAQADLHDYSGMYLRASGSGFKGVFANYPLKEKLFDGTNKLYAVERDPYIVKCNLKRNYPWHVLGIYDKDIDILTSELIYLLSTKTNDDYSWIKPGKAIWDWWNDRNIYNVDFKAGINTDTYDYLVDFASENNISYVLIDEGWSSKDDLLDLNPDVDMAEICERARAKGVGIILWAKWINVDRQMKEFFAQLSRWNVKGVKIDFMDRNDAKMVDFYERVAKISSRYHMMVDFHGSYPNEGMRALYPNLLTREGLIGMEYDKWSDKASPVHDLMIPFLRMWVGPMDYTPGAMLNSQPRTFFANQHEPQSQGTRTHQIAMYIVYESPLQMFSDSPTKYMENKECFDFIKSIPTVWDQTVPISGKIGEFIAIARRRGSTWYIGAMSGSNGKDIDIPLSFLGAGKYMICSCRDGVNSESNGKDYKIENEIVKNGQVLKTHLSPGGGFAAIITKLN